MANKVREADELIKKMAVEDADVVVPTKKDEEDTDNATASKETTLPHQDSSSPRDLNLMEE